MAEHEFDMLKLENQMCFPLYACSKEVIRRYKPFLDPLDLTYTQYITLMVLWEKRCISVKDLGACLYLDSGTLTPVLKKLESKGYITRTRCPNDERCVLVKVTPTGESLKQTASTIPESMRACVRLSPDDARQLYGLLCKLLATMEED